MNSICLMYHDVYGKDPRPAVPRSAAMYHVPCDSFEGHLATIRDSRRSVLCVRGYLDQRVGNSVLITFDDGWAGAFRSGLPMLQAAGLTATYFVTRDFVGRPGFCDRKMIREAAAAGMEIGVHGTTHRMLSALSSDEIVSEFLDCKVFLESMVGAPVTSASLPGGDVNPRIIACAQQAGLSALCTSRPGVNSAISSKYALRRIAVRSTTARADVVRFCKGNANWEVARWAAFEVPHSLLGMKNYSRLRRLMLGETASRGEVFRP